MIDYQKELNPEQRKVISEGNGPCLVLAGAGSGKTRAITYRVAYLLEQGVQPDEILLVTFTNKAAREMMNRVETLTHDQMKLPWSGTFHHISYRILKKYATLLGYKNNFTVLDNEDSLDLLKLCLKAEGIERTKRRFPSPSVLRAIISYARNAERPISEVLEEKHPNWSDLTDTILRIAEEYTRRKKEANTLDFDDLLVNLYLLLLNNERVRKLYAEQFKYILVDEYQDINKIQASIIRLLASINWNVLVVGDDAQSIYSFRAADIKNILDFETMYQEARVFRLETNYRSTPDILDVANVVIARNQHQYQKKLRSLRDRFTKPEVCAFVDQMEEAKFIAERILELRDEGIPLPCMAVLFRAAFHSQALELELTKRNISYEYRGGVRFFERAHVKGVLAYLRVFYNKNDVIAWSRVLNMQIGIGPATAVRIIEMVKYISENQVDISDTIEVQNSESPRQIVNELPPRAQIGWNNFIQVWNKLQKADGTPAGLINAILDSKYVEYLELEYPDYRERIQDIEQLIWLAERDSNLHHFLAESALQEQYALSNTQNVQSDEEKIVLSTIHQAKGLEWEAVFILNVSAGQFPNSRAVNTENGLEEERRLFYVAITRAKKYLYLTYPLTGNMGSDLQGQSQFLNEIDSDLITENSLPNTPAGLVFSDLNNNIDDIKYVAEDESFGISSSRMRNKPLASRNPKRSFLKEIDDL